MSNGILIYLAMLIPIIGLIFCSINFGKKLNIIERIAIIGIPLVTIIIIKYVSIANETQATEYINSYIVSATYTEHWSTWVHRICTRTVSCGKNCTTIQTYDCSYCDDNPAQWTVTDNLGRTYSISSDFFGELCNKWQNKSFVDKHRSINYSFGCGSDGDAYTTNFDNKFDHIVPYTTENKYENKIKASKSLFNFMEVDSTMRKLYGLYDYRKSQDPFSYIGLYGDYNPSANERLMRYNAKLGSIKKVHMMILVFNNKNIDAAFMQESYWKRGNQNEFILCIGRSDTTINWCKVLSWTDIQDLKIDVESKVSNMKYDLNSIIDTMALEVSMKFVKKDFKKDFNYITVEPSNTSLIVAYIVSLIITIGVCIFAVRNDCDL